MWIRSCVTFSDVWYYWLFHCFEECVGLHRCCASRLRADVCVCVWVFLLCHSDDTALANRRTGASVQPHPSNLWRTCLVTVSCWEPLYQRRLLGRGISWWEETAEACVVSALVQSTHAHIYECCTNLCSPSIIPNFFFCRGQTPTKAWAHNSQREAGTGRDKGTLKCLVKADRAAESSLMMLKLIICKDCHFVFLSFE